MDNREVVEALNNAVLLGLNNSDSDVIREMVMEYFVRDPALEDDDEDDDEEDEYWFENELDEEEVIADDNEDDYDVAENDIDPPILVDFTPAADDVLSNTARAPGDWSEEANRKELQQIADFSKCTRKTNKTEKVRCIDQFERKFILQFKGELDELTPEQRKMFILGMISSSIHKGEKCQGTKRGPNQKDRKHFRMKYSIEDNDLCRECFLFMQGISKNQLIGLVKRYDKDGVVVPKKKSGGRKANKNALSESDVRHIVTYVKNYATQHGLVIPGRVQGRRRDDPRIRLLPSHETKTSIWRKYSSELEEVNARKAAAGHTLLRIAKRYTFSKIWNQFCPFILTTRPKTDLCWMCQANNSSVYHSANESNELKRKRLEGQLKHLETVDKERAHYTKMVDESKKIVDGQELGPHDPCSFDIGPMHYSFDYAQQTHYPIDPFQPGPVYFLCPRKCGLFGVACEAIPQQVNYLIDEYHVISKGSNAVISYVHDFLTNHGLGEKHAQLNCDNCSGQNKNKYMLWYLCWRVLVGLHTDIDLHFLIAGHTKFAPDSGFGLLKKKLRVTFVSSLEDIKKTIDSSSTCGYNIGKVVGSENGEVFVPTYDWQSFLQPYFRPLKGIKSYHHFRFSNKHPGKVFFREFNDSEEQSFTLLKNETPPKALPAPLPSPGLSHERQDYLYNRIREFCSANCRDIVCPLPDAMED